MNPLVEAIQSAIKRGPGEDYWRANVGEHGVSVCLADLVSQTEGELREKETQIERVIVLATLAIAAYKVGEASAKEKNDVSA